MGKLFNIKIAEFWWDITCPFTTGVHSPPVPRYQISVNSMTRLVVSVIGWRVSFNPALIKHQRVALRCPEDCIPQQRHCDIC
jgi:hypothetical protein